MFNKNKFGLILLVLLTMKLFAVPIGEVVIIDIPWILDASSDSHILVGGVEGDAGAYYWTEDDGIVMIAEEGSASDVSDNGIIAGVSINEDGNKAACWWDINTLETHFVGSVPGSVPNDGAVNTVNCISEDGSTIAGLHWYSEGVGSAKAYKWTEDAGCVLLPDVMNWSDSRADCINSDGTLLGGYAGDNSFIWRPVLWNDDELIVLPYILDAFSTVSALSPNGEWCAGYNGSDGIVWHNQEIAGYETEGPEFIQIAFRTINDNGWAGGEKANWNTQVAYPMIWNPVDSLMNATDFFEEHGVIIPDDYSLFRIRKISNDNLTFICNGVDLNTSTYKSSIIKIPGPHSVSNLKAEAINGNIVNLTWNFEESTPGAQDIVIKRDGVEIASIDHSATDYLDVNVESGVHQYEVYVTYEDYDDSIMQTVSIEIVQNTPANLTAEVTDNDVLLTWEEPIDHQGLTNYKIYRDNEELVLVNETTYLDEDLEIGTYTYYVTAIFTDVESGSSNEVEVTVETGNSNEENEITGATALIGNYPNPFNPTTTISFSTIESSENTEIIVYNAKGHKVKTLLNDQIEAGNHTITWNGRDDDNEAVSSGIYLYKMKTAGYTEVKKMILMK